MKTRFFLTITFAILAGMASGQRPALELTFTAIDSAAWVQSTASKS